MQVRNHRDPGRRPERASHSRCRSRSDTGRRSRSGCRHVQPSRPSHSGSTSRALRRRAARRPSPDALARSRSVDGQPCHRPDRRPEQDEQGAAASRKDNLRRDQNDLDTGRSARRSASSARGGQIGINELTDTGDDEFIPLVRIRTHRTVNQSGKYRWYNDHRLPPSHGAGIITIRLHGTDEDTKRRFNRTENVRPIPPGDPDFARLYPRRSDAESINRHLDDTLWLRRAHSIGHHRQTLNIITYAVGVNALACQLHRQQAPPAAA